MPLIIFTLSGFCREIAGEKGDMPTTFCNFINVICFKSGENTHKFLFKCGSVVFVVCELTTC